MEISLPSSASRPLGFWRIAWFLENRLAVFFVFVFFRFAFDFPFFWGGCLGFKVFVSNQNMHCFI